MSVGRWCIRWPVGPRLTDLRSLVFVRYLDGLFVIFAGREVVLQIDDLNRFTEFPGIFLGAVYLIPQIQPTKKGAIGNVQ
jgi:hypothetical protein